jgi:hypothetical protein
LDIIELYVGDDNKKFSNTMEKMINIVYIYRCIVQSSIYKKICNNNNDEVLSIYNKLIGIDLIIKEEIEKLSKYETNNEKNKKNFNNFKQFFYKIENEIKEYNNCIFEKYSSIEPIEQKTGGKKRRTVKIISKRKAKRTLAKKSGKKAGKKSTTKTAKKMRS